MRTRSDSRSDSVLVAALFSVALHALVLALAGGHPFTRVGESRAPKPEQTIVLVQVVPPRQDRDLPQPAVRHAPGPARQSLQTAAIQEPEPSSPTTSTAPRQAASMEAPPAPTAEEWALAAQYTPKNSKRYRYTWGQQVRSMMGTAFEGPDQGMVRFRVEIAPDGALTRLETLWSTSPVAEQRAREAIENLPALPPTPTGKPLIFEKTISFQPFASDGPPIYRDDCLPDPPSFRNPFAWDGKSPHVRAEPPPVEEADPQSLEECLRQRPQDSVEAESAHDQRLRDQWDPTTLKR
jgi:hypothetical protein